MKQKKFKAWVGQAQKMVEVMRIFWHDGRIHSIHEKDGSEWFYGANPILLQFTGLLDKNGTEIYEGDVVKCGEKIYPVEYKIFSENGDAGFYLSWTAHSEVIGNIYQHPELLAK